VRATAHRVTHELGVEVGHRVSAEQARVASRLAFKSIGIFSRDACSPSRPRRSRPRGAAFPDRSTGAKCPSCLSHVPPELARQDIRSAAHFARCHRRVSPPCAATAPDACVRRVNGAVVACTSLVHVCGASAGCGRKRWQWRRKQAHRRRSHACGDAPAVQSHVLVANGLRRGGVLHSCHWWSDATDQVRPFNGRLATRGRLTFRPALCHVAERDHARRATCRR
jgi:hypothetical protein